MLQLIVLVASVTVPAPLPYNDSFKLALNFAVTARLLFMRTLQLDLLFVQPASPAQPTNVVVLPNIPLSVTVDPEAKLAAQTVLELPQLI